MRFDVITLFPELFQPFTQVGVIRRAFDASVHPPLLSLHLWPLREYAQGAYRRVDDRPFGGGAGMVMLVEPLVQALHAIRADQARCSQPLTPVIMFTPTGRPLTQHRVREISKGNGAVLVCGRYEGIDQRWIDGFVDEEISLGDYVLSGGELPALTLMDTVARLLPGVLQDQASHEQDSFSTGLLDYPHYTRPVCLDSELVASMPHQKSADVPGVLLSGHHLAIDQWRRRCQLALTFRRRPEIIDQLRSDGQLSPQDERFLSSLL